MGHILLFQGGGGGGGGQGQDVPLPNLLVILRRKY